jgi:hypothetical protein
MTVGIKAHSLIGKKVEPNVTVLCSPGLKSRFKIYFLCEVTSQININNIDSNRGIKKCLGPVGGDLVQIAVTLRVLVLYISPTSLDCHQD